MTSPAFTTPAAGGFLSFYYHAYGNSIGTLAVQTCAGSSCADVYQSTGATHSSATAAWTLFQTRLPYGTTRVVITGVVGASFTGDISIDTITIGINPPASLLQTAFACDFNYPAATSGTAIRDFCGMSRNALWRVDTGGTTPSSSTGPSRGQVCGIVCVCVCVRLFCVCFVCATRLSLKWYCISSWIFIMLLLCSSVVYNHTHTHMYVHTHTCKYGEGD